MRFDRSDGHRLRLAQSRGARPADDAERHHHVRPEPRLRELRGRLQPDGTGGSATEALPVTGATFSGTATVAVATAPATYALPCTVVDDQQRSSAFNISLTVAIPPNATCGAPATPINAVQGPGATSPIAGQVVDVEGIVTGGSPGIEPVEWLLSDGTARDAGQQSADLGRPLRLLEHAGQPRRSRAPARDGRGVLDGHRRARLEPDRAELDVKRNRVQHGQYASGARDADASGRRAVRLRARRGDAGADPAAARGDRQLQPRTVRPARSRAGSALSADADAWRRCDVDAAGGCHPPEQNRARRQQHVIEREPEWRRSVAPYPAPGLSAANTLRVGALVNPDPNGGDPAPLVGILDDRFGAYRIQPTAAVSFSNAIESPAGHERADRLTGWTVPRGKRERAELLHHARQPRRGDAAGADQPAKQDHHESGQAERRCDRVERGAELRERQHQRRHVHEFSAVADLTTSLATATGRNYQFIDTLNAANIVGGDITQNGTDAIRNVIIYDAGRVTPVGDAALYYQNDQNRPSLAQTFKPASGAKADSQTFTVVVNHFRSKGSACGGASDDPFQGNCNGMRLSMAVNVQTWLAGNPTSDPAGANWKYVLIGDFNAYFGEDPIQSFLGGSGYANLIAMLTGSNAYSHNFGSQAGYLDHALVNTALLPLVKNIAEVHVNADEPAALQALDSNLKSATAGGVLRGQRVRGRRSRSARRRAQSAGGRSE